jgi:hypothetical protein
MQLDIHVQRFLKAVVKHLVKHVDKFLFKTMPRNDERRPHVVVLRAILCRGMGDKTRNVGNHMQLDIHVQRFLKAVVINLVRHV